MRLWLQWHNLFGLKFLEHGQTVNSERYFETWRKLMDRVRPFAHRTKQFYKTHTCRQTLSASHSMQSRFPPFGLTLFSSKAERLLERSSLWKWCRCGSLCVGLVSKIYTPTGCDDQCIAGESVWFAEEIYVENKNVAFDLHDIYNIYDTDTFTT